MAWYFHSSDWKGDNFQGGKATDKWGSLSHGWQQFMILLLIDFLAANIIHEAQGLQTIEPANTLLMMLSTTLYWA